MTTDAGPGPDGLEWDVFISYDREDYAQAKEVQDELLKCVTGNGRTPRVYLDQSATGTPVGMDSRSYLEQAIRRSRYFLALYSSGYFGKSSCQWELNEAAQLRMPEQGRLIPVLLDREAVKSVPFTVQGVRSISATRPRWIEDVRASLELRPTGSRPVLRIDAPAAGGTTDVAAGHTLPPLTVTWSVPADAPRWPAGAVVTLAADPPGAGLTGTLSVPVGDGTAVFSDLAFQQPTAKVWIIASTPGCEPVMTSPFAVLAPGAPAHQEDGDHVVLAMRGRPVFFPGGQAVAVHDGLSLAFHAAGGGPAAAASLREQPRLWARGRHCLAVADWSGRVVIAAPDGTTRVVDLPAPDGARLHVPGALAFDEDVLYAGMWNGTVWSLSLDAADPARVLEHRAGVQVLAASGPDLLVGGFDGKLAYYAGNAAGARSYTLEPMLLAISLANRFAVVAGHRQVHRLDLATRELLQVTQPVTAIACALPDGELTAVIDALGQCVSFDAELAVRVGFRTVRGARLAAAGGGGRLLVLRYPDSTHALVRDGRTTYVNPYPMTISPDGKRAAISSGEELRLLPAEELERGQDPATGRRA